MKSVFEHTSNVEQSLVQSNVVETLASNETPEIVERMTHILKQKQEWLPWLKSMSSFGLWGAF